MIVYLKIQEFKKKMRKFFIFFFFFCCLVAGLFATALTYEQQKQNQTKAALNSVHGAQIKKSVQKHSSTYKIDPVLVYAVILTESGFNKNAVSSGGCKGLMQLAPNTFRARNVGTNIYDIDQNIHAGAKHLSGMIARYDGDVYRGLAAYNMGGGRVYKNKPVPTAGRNYANKVLYHKKILEQMTL